MIQRNFLDFHGNIILIHLVPIWFNFFLKQHPKPLINTHTSQNPKNDKLEFQIPITSELRPNETKTTTQLHLTQPPDWLKPTFSQLLEPKKISSSDVTSTFSDTQKNNQMKEQTTQELKTADTQTSSRTQKSKKTKTITVSRVHAS